MSKKVTPIIIALVLLFTPLSGFALDKGDATPKFANPDLTGKFYLSKNIIGKSWVILDFFATDCTGCKRELPELEKLYKEFGEKGLKVFVFATDKAGTSIVKPYFAEHPTTLTVLIDRYLVTAKKYGVEEIPSVFLINPDGKVMVKGVGYSEKVIREMRDILTKEMK